MPRLKLSIATLMVNKENTSKKVLSLIEPYGHKEKDVFLINQNPAVEAEMLKSLMDGFYTQPELSELLGISQPQISKRLKLLNLTPALFKKLKTGELLPSIARELAGFDKNVQKKYEEKEKVTLKEVLNKRRRVNLSSADLERAEDIGMVNQEVFRNLESFLKFFKKKSRVEYEITLRWK